MGPMVLSIRLDRADRIARERRKAKQFWPTPGVSLTSARACMRAVFARQRIQRHRRGAPPSSDSSGAPYGRNVRLADLLTAARKGPGPVPRRPVPSAPRKRSSIWWASLAGGSRHPSASCPVKKEGIPSRVMRCHGCVFGKRRICRSGVRVKSIMRSIHLGCTHMPGCAHDLTAERQIWMSA
jgi:hypothetical protein